MWSKECSPTGSNQIGFYIIVPKTQKSQQTATEILMFFMGFVASALIHLYSDLGNTLM